MPRMRSCPARTLAQALPARLARHRRRGAREALGRDLDWKHAEADAPPAEEQAAGGEARGAGKLGRGRHEIAHIIIGLEADEVGREHVAHQPRHFRCLPQHVRRREGHVQEEADRVGDPLGAQAGRECQQLVVVHPDQVVGAHQRHQGGGEAFVDRAIAGGVAPVVAHQLRQRVEQRPQHAVGKVVVVAVVFFARQVDGDIVHPRLRLDRGQRRAAVLGDLAGPAEPQPPTLFHQAVERHGEPAGLLAGRGHGHAVRNHDQPRHSSSDFRPSGGSSQRMGLSLQLVARKRQNRRFDGFSCMSVTTGP